MQLKITLYCPDCQSTNVKKNGRKPSRKQNYLCKDCGRQFIGGHALKYKGCHSSLTQKILPMPVRGVGISDRRDRFISVFQSDNHITGKDGTKGIEGNNCRLRHRIRRAFRKTCRFSKKLFNHLKAFNLVFYYINFGFVQ